MEELRVNAAPHIHSGASTRRIMLDVIIALLPAAIAGVVIFGLKALLVMCVCVATTVLCEYLFNLVVKKKQTVGDLSAVVTGLLLGMNLRADVPVWQCVIGSVFAIVVVKLLFGGIGKNFANPAITARVLMLLTFTGSVAGGAVPVIVDLSTGATPLVDIANGEYLPLLNMLIGTHGGAIGETCILALLAGFVYLLVRKVITWHTPVVFVATVFVLYFLLGGFDAKLAFYEILSGGLFLGAIFMATDYATTPVTTLGRIVFALGCGVITFCIRKYMSFPEGVSISILCMNLLVPIIEKFTQHKTLGGIK